jgi:hypothetical protein
VKSLLRASAVLAFAASAIACTRAAQSGPIGSANAWTQHGLLRIVDLQEPDSLNPIVGSFQIDNDLSDIWGGKFFEWSDKNAFVPDLVTVVPTLANGGISQTG